MIRIVLGFVFVFWAYRAFKHKGASTNMKILASAEAIAGILLVIGLYTQAAALFAALDLLVRLVDRIQKRAFLTDGVNYYLILLVMAVSLMFIGAGFFAFDLPL
ncbi:MAG: hypothetical protein KGJ90_03400 [Patescibacteria group bacterium]|nr:hypothetical protein [Patescibacteria group bacterium]